MWCDDTNRHAPSLVSPPSPSPTWHRWVGCFVLLGCLCLGLIACRNTKKAPTRKRLSYARDYLSWKPLSPRKTTNSHKYEDYDNAEIYINAKAFPLNNGDEKFTGQYPVGSTFVVINYSEGGEKQPHALVMRKMPAGYDPDNNNWRYSVVRLSDWTLDKDGRLVECIRCHQKQIARDYVPIWRKDFSQSNF